MAVPFRDNIVSGLLCIAALHHLASEERRVLFLFSHVDPEGEIKLENICFPFQSC